MQAGIEQKRQRFRDGQAAGVIPSVMMGEYDTCTWVPCAESWPGVWTVVYVIWPHMPAA